MAATDTRPLTRADLSQFIRDANGKPDMRAIISFENALRQIFEQAATTETGSFVTLSHDQAILPSSRILQVLAGELTLNIVDPAVNLGLADSGVVDATYGDATHLVVLAIDAKGRVTSASEVALNSDNVAEGVTNLYFTNTRARAAITGTAPIAFSAGGALSLNDTAVTPSSYGNATNVPGFTVDAKGRLTAAANVPINLGGTSATVANPITSLTTVNGIVTAATGTAGFTGTVAPVNTITVVNGIVTAVA